MHTTVHLSFHCKPVSSLAAPGKFGRAEPGKNYLVRRSFLPGPPECGTSHLGRRHDIVYIQVGNSLLWRSMFRRHFPGFFGLSFLPVFFLSFAGTAPAQSPTPAASAPVCAVSSDEFLNARLAVWRQRLKLDDWKISIVPSHTDDLKPGTLGHIHWDADQKIASIRVLDASDYRLACPDALNDMELTVVHELVHLVLSSVSRSVEADRGAEEHTVNQISKALLELDRQSSPPGTR